MASLRCSLCGLNFPNDPKRFRKCPECEEKTSVIANAKPMPDDEAQSLLNHATFERFYAEREAREC